MELDSGSIFRTCTVSTQTMYTWPETTTTPQRIPETKKEPSDHNTVMDSSNSSPTDDNPNPTHKPITHHVWLFFDGASRGNPGPAGCGAFSTMKNILHETHKTHDKQTHRLTRTVKRIPDTTNNVAEWSALAFGLEDVCTALRDLGIDSQQVDLRIRGDSRLIIQQLLGQWKVHDAKFAECYAYTHELLRMFGKWSASHVYRQQNKIADKLANEALCP